MHTTRPVSAGLLLSLKKDHAIVHGFWIVGTAALTAIAAQIEIPNTPVPFTFQTLVVLLAGGLLGPRNGFFSMMLYLGLGAAGLPVFSSGGFGLVRILGPTGGYLLAFPVAAWLIGTLMDRRGDSVVAIGGSMVAGLLVIFLMGTIQLNVVLIRDWSAAFKAGFLIFSWWDILKLFAAIAIVRQVKQGKSNS
ncbi:MAG: biotin transporter BioY [Bacteroidota bacterium]